MSTAIEMNTQVPVIDTPVVKAKPLAAKYKNYTKFAYWFIKRLQSEDTIQGDFQSVIKSLGIYLNDVDEKQVLFDDFENDSKEIDKEMKQLVKVYNKPAPKPRKSSKKKVVETDVVETPEKVQTPEIVETVLEKVLETTVEKVVETDVEKVVETAVEAESEPVKKERKKTNKKKVVVEADNIVAQIVEAANSCSIEAPDNLETTTSPKVKKEKKSRKKSTSLPTVAESKDENVIETVVTLDRKESLDELDATTSPETKTKVVKKTSKKSKDEEPVKDEQPILTEEQQSVLDELEVETYEE
jgi:hypothetical protein